MLQLQLKELDICRVSKILAKYNIKASIANKTITLEGNISDELLSRLCNSITICTVQNFPSEVVSIGKGESNQVKSNEALLTLKQDSSVDESTGQGIILAPKVMQKYDLIYPTVKRGEVYICDFGEPYGHEQGFIRPAIVVQNDVGNFHAPTTIVLPCTAEDKKSLPVNHFFHFSDENMFDYNSALPSDKNVIMAEQIRPVDKTRLRSFIGTMTSEFMDDIQKIIDISLSLKRSESVIVEPKPVYIDRIVYKNVPVIPDTYRERRDINMAQIKMLSIVNAEELFRIFETRSSDKVKIEKILCLFGFDMQKNGVQYLAKAILISPKDAYFNLETLCENISKDESDIEKDEIKRLIIARVKERFKLGKSSTISFIRLINGFLTKKEDEQDEETDI